MKFVSLTALAEREYKLLDEQADYLGGLPEHVATDTYMRLNNGTVGEDSEELTLRQKHTDKVLQKRPLPSYNPR